MSNDSIKRAVVLLDNTGSPGAAVGPWVRLDSRYDQDTNRALQGQVAGGTVTLEGTTVDNLGGPVFGQDVLGNGAFDSAGAWIFGPNWDLNLANSGVAASDGTQTALAPLTQANHLIAEGSTYTLTFDILNYVSGTITPVLSGTTGTVRSADGTYTELLVAGAEFHRLTLLASADFVGEIDNVSLVLEVPAIDVGILQTYAADFTDVLNSSWTYVRARIDVGTAKVQGMI